MKRLRLEEDVAVWRVKLPLARVGFAEEMGKMSQGTATALI